MVLELVLMDFKELALFFHIIGGRTVTLKFPNPFQSTLALPRAFRITVISTILVSITI